jgi:FAD/FMN-containing dehydrogenase
MPETPTPKTLSDAEPTSEVSIDLNSSDMVVHVIQSCFYYRDQDNYPKCDEDLVADEGWFADNESAAARCEQLNARNRAFYDTSMATKKRAHDRSIQEAERKNLEAAAIRAAGMQKSDVAVPKPFVPETFERFFAQSNHTVFEPVQIRRSDHDGIARARTADSGDDQASEVKSSTEVTAA